MMKTVIYHLLPHFCTRTRTYRRAGPQEQKPARAQFVQLVLCHLTAFFHAVQRFLGLHQAADNYHPPAPSSRSLSYHHRWWSLYSRLFAEALAREKPSKIDTSGREINLDGVLLPRSVSWDPFL